MSGTAPLSPGGPSEAIGLVVEHCSPEAASASAQVGPHVLQPHGIVHGGVYGLIAESICSLATDRAVAGEGQVAMGMSNHATFLRPISAGTIHAQATRRHRGRTTWLWDVEITDDAGRLCAMVRMTIAVRPRPDEPRA